MLIKVKGANFAANSIGKIDLPITDSDVIAYLKAIKPVAPVKQQAINNFVVGLKSNGLWDKIKYLQLPKATNNENSMNVNLKGGTDKITFPTAASRSTNGISLNGNTFTQSLKLNKAEFHAGAYNTTAEGDNSTGRVIFTIPGAPEFISGRRMADSFNTGGMQLGGTNGRVLIPNHTATVGSMLFAVGVNENKQTVIMDSELATSAIVNTPTTTETTNVLFGTYNNTWNATAYYGLFTLGDYLTDDELVLYDALIITLMTLI